MSDELWIVVPRWDDFQHYKDRDPTWIKNYVRLLDDDDYLNLTETQRAVLHSIWMAYAKANGKLSADTRTLSRKFNLRVTKPTIEALADAGFISVSASRPLSMRSKSDSQTIRLTRARARSQEVETEEETQRQEPTPTAKPINQTPVPKPDTEQPHRSDPTERVPSDLAEQHARNGTDAWKSQLDIQPLDPHTTLRELGGNAA